MSSVSNDESEGRVEAEARRALLDAAKAFLPVRPPSTVTGRELAEAAGVNYGLIHHYFGSKDNAFREALLELRSDFLDSHEIASLFEMLEPNEPFFRAVGLSQTDYPRDLGAVDDFPAGEALVAAIRARTDTSGDTTGTSDHQARARVMAMLCLQVGHALFGDLLHAVVGAGPENADSIEAEFAQIYRDTSGGSTG